MKTPVNRSLRRSRGLSLPELLVAMALFSVVSLVTLQLYLSAYTEFEHSSGTMTLNQRARVVIDKITQALKTATPLLNANTEAFVHPNSRFDFTREMYEVDFISSICFMANPTLSGGNPTWPVTDNTSAAYISDPNDMRAIYETDTGLTALVTRQPPLYRYRIAWNHLTTPLTTKGRNVPARAVYFERLNFANGNAPANNGQLGWGEGPNTAAVSSYDLSPWIADTGTPMAGANMRARLIGRNVHYLTFTRTAGNIVLLRMKMYNRDPITNIPVEGMTMRRPGHGGNADPNNRSRQRYFIVDLTTNIQLPNTL
jgi:prepilin-type N-terminal cleavage/methylation domain-containing protein